MKDWKSTVAAILSGIIGTLTGVMTYQVPAALMTPAQAHTWLWITVACNILAISCRVWVGVLTNNADAAAVAGAINNVAQAGPGAAPVTPATIAQTPAKTAVVLLALLLGGSMVLTGCKPATAPAGPTAQTPYQKAATVMLDFSQDVKSAQQTVIALHNGKAIGDSAYRDIQGMFAQIAAYGPQIDALIGAQASAATIQARVDSAMASLQWISTIATAGTDAATANQVKVAVQALSILLSQLTGVFNSAQSTNEVIHGSINDRAARRTGSSDRHSDLSADRSRAEQGWRASEAALRDSGRSRRELRADRSRFAGLELQFVWVAGESALRDSGRGRRELRADRSRFAGLALRAVLDASHGKIGLEYAA